MNFSLASFKHFLPDISQDTIWWVAFSGGLDSCVLLHALATLKLPVQLHALHVNHQISPYANEWQQHCANFCAHLGVSFTAVKVDVENCGRGLEDAARNERYKVFENHLKSGDYLFTAHHADDQTETVLLHLMRGAGLRGLAGMAYSRSLGQGIVYRPLLNFTRAELEVYAYSHGLAWVNDESNRNDHYDRNYLRNQVMPVLRERWPAFAQKWQQTAELCAANEVLIEELAAQDLIMAAFQSEFMGTSIALSKFADLSVARRHNLLRTWSRGQDLCIPEQQHLTQIENQIIGGRADAETQVNWGNVSLRVYRARLYALPLADLSTSKEIANVIEISPEMSIIDLPQGCQLQFIRNKTTDKPLLMPGLPNLHIRFRQGGERCRPAGRAHSQTLKRLLQDYGIEPWRREWLPLIYSGDNLVAVCDLWVCADYVAPEHGYCLKYTRKSK